MHIALRNTARLIVIVDPDVVHDGEEILMPRATVALVESEANPAATAILAVAGRVRLRRGQTRPAVSAHVPYVTAAPALACLAPIRSALQVALGRCMCPRCLGCRMCSLVVVAAVPAMTTILFRIYSVTSAI